MGEGTAKITLRSYCVGAARAGLCGRGWLAALALCLSGTCAASGTAPLSFAQGQALAGARQCMGCHQIDAPRVGPPFRAVARRFRGDLQAAPYLAQVMRQGSRGQWGAIPMPAQSRLSPADALHLAQWILSLSGR